MLTFDADLCRSRQLFACFWHCSTLVYARVFCWHASDRQHITDSWILWRHLTILDDVTILEPVTKTFISFFFIWLNVKWLGYSGTLISNISCWIFTILFLAICKMIKLKRQINNEYFLLNIYYFVLFHWAWCKLIMYNYSWYLSMQMPPLYHKLPVSWKVIVYTVCISNVHNAWDAY